MKGLGPPDEARVAQAEANLDEVFAYYNKVLAKQKYLAGDRLTLVDLYHLPNGSALKAFGYKGTFESIRMWMSGSRGYRGERLGSRLQHWRARRHEQLWNLALHFSKLM